MKRSKKGSINSNVIALPTTGSIRPALNQEKRLRPGGILLGALTREASVRGQRALYVDDNEALVFLANRVLSRLWHSMSNFTDPK